METRMYINMQVTPVRPRLNMVNITDGKKLNQKFGFSLAIFFFCPKKL